MKTKLAALMLATTMVLSAAAPSYADSDTTTDVVLHTLSLPFRLVTGGLTGTYGLIEGGAREAYDMSADVNDRVVDAGTTPAQLLLWPFTLPIGFVKGGVEGFAHRFPDGYSYWDTWTE